MDAAEMTPQPSEARGGDASPMSPQPSDTRFARKSTMGSIKDKHALARLQARANCIEMFATFLEEKGSPILRVWFQHFDKNRAGKISHKEFRSGLQTLRYTCDIDGLWSDINSDNSDELFFEDVALKPDAAGSANTWNDFRRWAGVRFQNPKDMVRQVKKAAERAESAEPSGGPRASRDMLFEHEAIVGLSACGWEGGEEELLWALMDSASEGCLALKDLKWLEVETKRGQAKEAARKRASKLSQQRAKSKILSSRALSDFKAMLRKMYGPLFRAWRRVLDRDGSMTLQRAELFKVCRELRWDGNMRWLWKALDHDGSGATTFEELDASGAQQLAEFKRWATSTWGPRFASPMFRDFDQRKSGKLTYKEFADACEAHGHPFPKAHAVAAALDYKLSKKLQEGDVEILELYRPPDWLLAEANLEAAEEFKQALLKKYGHFVRGWRSAMDKDGSNNCNWYEFTDAAKRIKFTGDIAGAWRAFDLDLSGSICLKEVDPVAHKACMDFKIWADQEFGGIRAAYRIMDTDRSNAISWREFRSACRSFGYTGDVATLFESLDQQGTKNVLHYEEVSFLDLWDTTSFLQADVDDSTLLEGTSEEKMAPAKTAKAVEPSNLPGPGSYDLPFTFAAGPTTPLARNAGSFSFGTRLRRAWSRPRLGPADYDPVACTDTVRSKKPAWSFGSADGPPPQILGMRNRERAMVPLRSDLAPVLRVDSRGGRRSTARSTIVAATAEDSKHLRASARCPARLSLCIRR